MRPPTARMNQRQSKCVFGRRLKREKIAKVKEDICSWTRFTREGNLSYVEREGYDSDESHTLKTLIVGILTWCKICDSISCKHEEPPVFLMYDRLATRSQRVAFLSDSCLPVTWPRSSQLPPQANPDDDAEQPKRIALCPDQYSLSVSNPISR